MDLREYYIETVQETDYHYKFWDLIKDVNQEYDFLTDEYRTNNIKFDVFDEEEAIAKFKELCEPNKQIFSDFDKCWFYLIAFYLNDKGYVIKEFPRILARPPIDPITFTYYDIRNKLKAEGKMDSNGNVKYAERRLFVSQMSFVRKANHIQIDADLEEKFREISTRQASLDSMTTDEKLSEIANMIELLLKHDGNYKSLDYPNMFFKYISEEDVKAFRHQLQCFRHASSSSLGERKSYTNQQKLFLIDYGLTIIKAIETYLSSIN